MGIEVLVVEAIEVVGDVDAVDPVTVVDLVTSTDVHAVNAATRATNTRETVIQNKTLRKKSSFRTALDQHSWADNAHFRNHA